MHFLITAGGTREYIDPVRFISNASSGRMGYALARAALQKGHEVTLITAPVNLREPAGAKVINVESGEEMFAAVKVEFGGCDRLIMAAAVSDYTAAKRAKNKIKRTDKNLTIELKPAVDILKWAGRHKAEGQVVVGFALEDRAVRSRAEGKLKKKNLDMIIANSPAAIGADRSSVQIKARGGEWIELPLASKTVIAKKIISLLTLTD